jgi:hypothetical protein
VHQAIGEQREEADGEAEAERRAEIADQAGKQRAAAGSQVFPSIPRFVACYGRCNGMA